eukprot:6161467-Pyramimonas_sp.AAC.1
MVAEQSYHEVLAALAPHVLEGQAVTAAIGKSSCGQHHMSSATNPVRVVADAISYERGAANCEPHAIRYEGVVTKREPHAEHYDGSGVKLESNVVHYGGGHTQHEPDAISYNVGTTECESDVISYDGGGAAQNAPDVISYSVGAGPLMRENPAVVQKVAGSGACR